MCRKVDGADRVIAFPSPFSFFLPLSPNSLSLSQVCLHLLLPFSPSLIPSSVICFPFPNSMFLFFLFSNISPLLHCRVSKPLPPLLSRPGPVAPCQRDLTRVSRRSVACNSNKWRAKRVGRSQRDLANVGPFCRGWRTVGYLFGARLYIYRRLTSRFSNSFGGRIMRFEERERRKEFFSMETRARDFEETFRGGMFVERLRCSMSCCYLWRMGIVLSIETTFVTRIFCCYRILI